MNTGEEWRLARGDRLLISNQIYLFILSTCSRIFKDSTIIPVENMPNAEKTWALITFTKVSTAFTAEKEKDRRQL